MLCVFVCVCVRVCACLCFVIGTDRANRLTNKNTSVSVRLRTELHARARVCVCLFVLCLRLKPSRPLLPVPSKVGAVGSTGQQVGHLSSSQGMIQRTRVNNTYIEFESRIHASLEQARARYYCCKFPPCTEKVRWQLYIVYIHVHI